MARPGMASVAIFNFLGLWNQFLLPVALNTNRDNYVLSQGMAAFASRCPRGRASSGFVVRRTGGDRYSHAVIAHLPSALRCRVVLGVVAALLAGSGVLGAAAVGAHSVWMQARAEALVGSEPHVAARYHSDDTVRIQDGRDVELWRTMTAHQASPNDGGKVRVVLLPADDRAFLVDDVPPADYPLVLRVIDWLWFLAFDGARFFGLALLLAYGAVRLALGFTPLALASLLRGRDGVDAVVVDWVRLAKPDEALVSAAVGDVTHRWRTRVGSGAPPRLGDTLRIVGRVREGGWVVGWTDESRLLPTRPLHTSDAEVVRT